MTDRIGQQIGNYQLIQLLGEGGFAQVYLGNHVYLDTQAAIKVMSTQIASGDIDWFRTEARTVARLLHPNIVRVLDFGVDNTTPFLVMDYAPNGTLRQRVPRGRSLSLSSTISYVKQMAEALQYAHDQKLIHRDVKPENMLVGRNNEILLSDFGVALVAQSSRMENLQNLAGTIAYMAPEQIQGRPTPGSDQYSLAIVAYEWLSGKRPFSGSFTEIVAQQLAVSPSPLREKLPGVAPALEQVLSMALEKDPRKRFKTIREFAQALEQASQDTSSVSLPSMQPLATFLPSLSAPSMSAGNRPPASVMASRPIGSIISTYQGHRAPVRTLSWAPDGVRIISAGDEKTVHLWDGPSGNTLVTFQDTADAVRLIAWSPDDLRMATSGSDMVERIWDRTTNKLISAYAGHGGYAVNAMAWNPGPQSISMATSGDDGVVHVWNAMNGQPITMYRGHTGGVNAVAWSPDGASIASGGNDASLHIWDAFTGRNTATDGSRTGKIASVAWSPDGKHVAVGRDDGGIQWWNIAVNSEVLSYRHPTPVNSVSWSSDGRRFAFVSSENTILVWSTETNGRLCTFQQHKAPIHVMAWSPDGRRIASGGEDKIIYVWSAV